MAVSVFTLVYTFVALYLIQRLAKFASWYIRTLIACRKVPGLPGTRLIQGDLWFSSYDDFFYNNLKYTGETGVKIYSVWLYFFYPYYSVTHPDTAKVIFTNSVPKGDFVGNAYTILRPWIGNGILAHHGGPEWERNRKLLTPAFHFEILKSYVILFNRVAEEFLIQLSKSSRSESIEICSPVQRATLDALLRCAFSYEGRVQELGRDHPYVNAVHRLSVLYMYRINNPLLYPDWVFRRTRAGKEFYSLCDYVHNFAQNIIEERRKAISGEETESKRHPDFLDILLQARDDRGQGLTKDQIRAEADTFLFAGHDTTSASISWAIYALAKYPEEQKRVYQEVMDVVGDGEVEWEHLSELKYLQAFIKETMRMYSIVPLLGRTLSEPMTFDGITLPENSPVEINIAAINHRPDIWPDHEEFRPDRFATVDSDRDPFSYVPFSAGSRNCIGQNFALNEQKVVLARLVQTFKVGLDSSHAVIGSPALVMRAKNGIKVFLTSR